MFSAYYKKQMVIIRNQAKAEERSRTLKINAFQTEMNVSNF